MEGYVMRELIFHKEASHHLEKEISKIKNEISSAHGQKTLPPLNFLSAHPLQI